jgi:hypothetical protein
MRRAVLAFVALVLGPHAAWPQGNPLGPEFRVNTYTINRQEYASVAADASGNFVVVWRSTQDGSGYGVFGQRYASSGAPLGQEFFVHTYATGSQDRPDVASDPAGNFVVVWQSPQDGSFDGVMARRFASSGTPFGPEFRVNTFTTSLQVDASVAADTAGNFVVVWTSYFQDSQSADVFGQRYGSSGTPVGPEFRVNTYTTANQFISSVAADASGNFVVVWASWGQDGSLFGIFGQRFASSGAPLGPEFRVNTFTTGYQLFPSVAADSSGNFVVVWHSNLQDGSNFGVFGQRYASSGSPLGPEFRVNTFTTSYQSVPSVASDPAGNFVVAWTSYYQDGSVGGAFAQRYDSSGVPLGPEFRVNTYVTDAQTFPVVAADAAGEFVVIWRSDYQDGSSFGVYGQRYSQIVPVELMHFRVE